MNTIANRIKQISNDKNLTVTAIAAIFGENRQRIQDIEAGKQRLPEDIILKYIEHFNIDANWLMTGNGNMYRSSNSVQEQSNGYQVKPIGTLESIIDRLTKLENEVQSMKSST